VTIRGAGGGGFGSAVQVNNGQGTTFARVAIVDNALIGLIVNRGNVQLLSSLVARNTGRGVGGISSQSSGEGFTLI